MEVPCAKACHEEDDDQGIGKEEPAENAAPQVMLRLCLCGFSHRCVHARLSWKSCGCRAGICLSAYRDHIAVPVCVQNSLTRIPSPVPTLSPAHRGIFMLWSSVAFSGQPSNWQPFPFQVSDSPNIHSRARCVAISVPVSTKCFLELCGRRLPLLRSRERCISFSRRWLYHFLIYYNIKQWACHVM